jgi:hypothetical protein
VARRRPPRHIVELVVGLSDLAIAVEERADGVLLSVAGEIDLATSAQLKRALDR